MQTWRLKGLPNDRHNPGRQRKGQVVGFCSPEYAVEGKLGLGGRRRVAAAEGWGTSALARRINFFHWWSV